MRFQIVIDLNEFYLILWFNQLFYEKRKIFKLRKGMNQKLIID